MAEMEIQVLRIHVVAWLVYSGDFFFFLHQDFLYFKTRPTVDIGQLTATKECNEKSTPCEVK